MNADQYDRSLDLNTTIVVNVGEPDQQREFTVLHSFATKSSKLMQRMFSRNWRESRDGRVSLPETKVADFEVYLEWLYTGYVVTLDELWSLGPTLLRLYLLGDFLIDDRFCNAVIDALIGDSQAVSPWLVFYPTDIDSVWNKTMPGSRMRKVLVDLIIRDLSRDIASPSFKNKGTWCHEVTVDILARMAETKQAAVELFAVFEDQAKVRQAMRSAVGHPKNNKNKCADYHKHGEGYPACT